MQHDVLVRINDLVNIPEQPEKVHVYKSGLNKGKFKRVSAKPASRGLVGVGKTTIWRWVQEGFFPKPIKLSDHVTAWRLSDVQNWLDERARESLGSE